MTKLYLDKKRRSITDNVIVNSLAIKGIIKEERLDLGIRTESKYCYTERYRYFFRNKVKNRCILTSRSRGVKLISRLSRMQTRLAIHSGYLSGFYKKNASI